MPPLLPPPSSLLSPTPPGEEINVKSFRICYQINKKKILAARVCVCVCQGSTLIYVVCETERERGRGISSLPPLLVPFLSHSCMFQGYIL